MASKTTYVPGIDGLRAIAVLGVVIYHLAPSVLPGGFAGVDVFFVISGYLITGIIFREILEGRFSFREFYRRRAIRILPPLIAMLAAVLCISWLYLTPDEFKTLGRHALAGLLFVSNFQLLSESGYFDTASELKPLLHLWSLGIEEQFYILWPTPPKLFTIPLRASGRWAQALFFKSSFCSIGPRTRTACVARSTASLSLQRGSSRHWDCYLFFPLILH